MVLVCCAVSVLSNCAIILLGRRELVVLILLHLMSGPVCLSRCAVGWSAVCDCGNWYTHLRFSLNCIMQNIKLSRSDSSQVMYSKTCVQWPLSKRPAIGFQG